MKIDLGVDFFALDIRLIIDKLIFMNLTALSVLLLLLYFQVKFLSGTFIVNFQTLEF